MAKKKQAEAKAKATEEKVLHLVHRGIEFAGRRIEAGPEPVEVTGWLPPNVIEHWERVKVLSVWEGGADGSGTAG